MWHPRRRNAEFRDASLLLFAPRYTLPNPSPSPLTPTPPFSISHSSPHHLISPHHPPESTPQIHHHRRLHRRSKLHDIFLWGGKVVLSLTTGEVIATARYAAVGAVMGGGGAVVDTRYTT
jgi:hypothetical protein